MDDFRGVYTMSEAQMPDWNAICRAFAKREGAKLLFVNNTSCGLQYPDETMVHVSIADMAAYLGLEI